MNLNRPLTPAFLKKWDEKLLLKNPDGWSSRTHLAVYYSVLLMSALTVICFTVPNDPRTRSNVSVWVTFISLLVLVGFIVWLIYLLRFNVFKRFGNLRPADDLKTFLLYFLTIGIMVLTTYFPPAIETIRANRAYTSPEIVSDINGINTMVLQLERDSVPRKWDADSFVVVNTLKGRAPLNDDDYAKRTSTTDEETLIGSVRVAVIDTAEFHERYSSTDSLVKLNDSLYVYYKCPEYTFVSSNNAPAHTNIRELTSADLYHKVLVNYQHPNRETTNKAIRAIVTKYIPYLEDLEEYTADESLRDYEARIKFKYNLHAAQRSIDNITNRKYRWDETTINISGRIFYYVTLLLSVLVFAFRRTTARTFFLTLLAVLLISMLTSLFFAFAGGDQISSYATYFVYYIVFLILAVALSTSRIRSVFGGISLNLVLFLTPFIPLVSVAYYYALLTIKHQYDKPYPYKLFENQLLHFTYGEMAGFVLLLLMVSLFFSRKYRLWYAQPEQ
jgi:hypothetical protein